MALTCTWTKDRTDALVVKWPVDEAPMRHWRKPHAPGISIGEEGAMTSRRATTLPGRPSPFVTQSQLIELLRTDSSDIEWQILQAEQMMRHPHQGMSTAPYLLMDDWRRFLCWTDGVIQHLEQPRPVPELEHGLTY